MRAWLTDLRKTALLAAIGFVAGIAPVINPAYWSRQLAYWKSLLQHPGYANYAFAAMILVGLGYLALFLGFLIALGGGGVVPRIPARLRHLTWAVATVSAALWVVPWSGSILNPARLVGLKSLEVVIRLVVGLAGDITWVLFLVALARYRSDGERSESPGGPLRVFARVGTITGGIILAGIVLGAVAFAFQYPSFKALAFENLRDIEPLGSVLLERLRFLLLFATQFAPFFVIDRSIAARRRLA